MEPYLSVGGLDEVGRGCLAGPILSVAAVFHLGHVDVPVQDSKKINAPKRKRMFKQILRSSSLIDFGIGEVSAAEIDDMGIDRANILSFERALEALRTPPEFLIVDGCNGVPGWGQRQEVVPRADGTYPVVSAASILAKVIRDTHMEELDTTTPGYNWKKNKGYGTRDHIEALTALGPSKYHRRHFIRRFCTPNQMGL